MAKCALSQHPQTHAHTYTHDHEAVERTAMTSASLMIRFFDCSSTVVRDFTVGQSHKHTHTHTHIDWSELLNAGQVFLDIMLTTICKTFCTVAE